MKPLWSEGERWLAELTRRGCSGRTVTLYRGALSDFMAFAGSQPGAGACRRAADVTAEVVLAWRAALVGRGLSGGTLDVYVRAVRVWVRWLVERGELFTDPLAELVVSKWIRPLQPVPSVAEVLRWIEAPNVATVFGVRDRALLELAYSCGARREELVGLDLGALDLDHGTVRVLGKGRRERVLPLGETAVLWLRRYVEKTRPRLLKKEKAEPALWIDNRGKRLASMALEHALDRHAVAVGLPEATPHTLRRACATHLLQGGAHPVYVQQLLGHATLRHLAHYLRLSIVDLKATHGRSNPGK